MNGGEITRGFKYRIYPTRKQAEALDNQLGFACDLYNAALEQRRTAYRLGHRVKLADQQHELTHLRGEIGPGDMNFVAQEMVLQRLHLAFDAFFRRLRNGEGSGFPRFKPRQRFNTLAWRIGQGGAAIVNDRLRIQGVGHIKVKWHREIQGEVRQTRITRRNGRWYVAFTVRCEAPEPLPSTGRQVGVDVGVARLASLSNGVHLTGPRARHSNAKKVRRIQRAVARKRLGSKRRRRQGQQLARLREKERNRRADRAHKIAKGLVDRFDLIAIEDLQIFNMVRGNRGLNREIHDQGWGVLFRCLAYKAESAGRELVAVDPRNTSRTCAECGTVDAASRKGRHFNCVECGHAADSDTNAARNILARALARTEPSGANAIANGALPEKPETESSQPRGAV